MRKLNCILLFIFLAPFTLCLWSFAGPLSPQEEDALMTAQWKLPQEFHLKRVESLLNHFCEETQGKAFRYIGVEEDFFHGHVLFEKKNIEGKETLFPRAILYHTQEEAHKAHWLNTIDPKYDYLNITTRNWIQWLHDDHNLDGGRIENAREYLDFQQKDPNPFFDESSEPQKNHHYTIHAKNLDPGKLGFKLAGELQFEFYRDMKSSPYGEDRTVRIILGEEEILLHLFTHTIYLDRS